MKTQIQKSYRESKWEGRKIGARTLMDPSNSLTDALALIPVSAGLNATPVTNAMLYCICFFSGDILGKYADPSSIIFDSPVLV